MLTVENNGRYKLEKKSSVRGLLPLCSSRCKGPLTPDTGGGLSPIEPILMAQQGQVNRPPHRKSHMLGLMFVIMLFVPFFCVHSLSVLAERGELHLCNNVIRGRGT